MFSSFITLLLLLILRGIESQTRGCCPWNDAQREIECQGNYLLPGRQNQEEIREREVSVTTSGKIRRKSEGILESGKTQSHWEARGTGFLGNTICEM